MFKGNGARNEIVEVFDQNTIEIINEEETGKFGAHGGQFSQFSNNMPVQQQNFVVDGFLQEEYKEEGKVINVSFNDGLEEIDDFDEHAQELPRRHGNLVQPMTNNENKPKAQNKRLNNFLEALSKIKPQQPLKKIRKPEQHHQKVDNSASIEMSRE